MDLREVREVMKETNFNVFCEKYLDGLYDSKFDYESQGSGYKQLKVMVENQISPATKEETERWENNPTTLELGQIPDIKYMRSLHPILRDYVRDNWEYIKDLKL